MIAFAEPSRFLAALDDLPSPSAAGMTAACERQADLTKPRGALGRLEEIAIFMAGWQGTPRPSLERARAVVFAGNHGVTARGVSAFPAEVTAQMVANFAAGGAAINVLARVGGAELSIVSLDLDHPTADITHEPAMTEAACLSALNAGAAVVAPDTQLLLVGEMGIGNTTPAAAICAATFGGEAAQWCGRGTGIDEPALSRKVHAVEQALKLHRVNCGNPFETLRRLGGREIAAMAGAVLAARMLRVPVLLDGFVVCAAVAPLLAERPELAGHCIAAHCSAEAAHRHLLSRLGLEPLLDLGLRLGEGSGAALALPLIRAALATHEEMATFAEAAVARAR